MNPSSIPPAVLIPGLDVAAAMARLDLSYDEFKELLAVFPDALHEETAKLQKAVAQGKAEPIRFAAHALTGLAGNYGATLLWEEAKAMEEAVRSNQLAQACAMLPKIVSLSKIVGAGVKNALE